MAPDEEAKRPLWQILLIAILPATVPVIVEHLYAATKIAEATRSNSDDYVTLTSNLLSHTQEVQDKRIDTLVDRIARLEAAVSRAHPDAPVRPPPAAAPAPATPPPPEPTLSAHQNDLRTQIFQRMLRRPAVAPHN